MYDSNPGKIDQIEVNPTEIIKTAIENARPVMNLEKVKVGSVTYFVPTPISERRSYFEGMRWIHQAAEDRDTSDKNNM